MDILPTKRVVLVEVAWTKYRPHNLHPLLHFLCHHRLHPAHLPLRLGVDVQVAPNGSWHDSALVLPALLVANALTGS